MRRLRIRDLLAGRTLIEADYGRDLIAYHRAHYRPGYSEWLWQYLNPSYGWTEIPGHVRREWAQRSSATPAE